MPLGLAWILADNPRVRRQQIHALLWTAQASLAMFFMASGYAKLFEPIDLLVVLLGWPAGFEPVHVRGLGAVEVSLAALILVPLLSWRWGRVPMRVAAVALAGLEIVMLAVHVSAREIDLAGVNVVLLALTLLVIRGRREARGPGAPEPVHAKL